MSISEKPSCCMAVAIRSGRSLSNMVVRATSPAPFTATVEQISNGCSRLPSGVVAVRASGGGGDRMLAPGHAEVEIVKHDDGDADITARGVDQMVPANAAAAIPD